MTTTLWSDKMTTKRRGLLGNLAVCRELYEKLGGNRCHNGTGFFSSICLLRFFNMCCPYLMAVDTKSMGLSFVRHLLDFSSNQNRMANEKSPTDRISIWFANEMQRDEIRRRWIPFFGFLAKRFQLQTVWFYFFFLFSFLPSFVISFHTSSFDNLIMRHRLCHRNECSEQKSRLLLIVFAGSMK